MRFCNYQIEKSRERKALTYYPFGLTIDALSWERDDATENRFLYNSKELQDELDLGWYDYGARMYDAALGRWHVVDPLAGQYYDLSPYNYVANNPVIYIDPDGNRIWDPKVDENGGVSYVAEEGDNAATFQSQFGLTSEQATKILSKNGFTLEKALNGQEIKEGDVVEGESVEEVTGSEVLQLDYESEEATDQTKTEQLLFAIDYSNVNDKSSFNVGDFFQNFEPSGLFGSDLFDSFKGQVDINGQGVDVSVLEFPVKYNTDIKSKANVTGGKPVKGGQFHNFTHYRSSGTNYPAMLIQIPRKQARSFANRYYNP